MTRRPKTDRVPRTRAGGQWTEASYWGFLRSGLRQLSIKWPPISAVLRANRRPNQSANRRLKWEHQCELCREWFPAKDIQVDHIDGVGTGSLRSWEEFAAFAERLFCESDKLRKTCRECNQGRRNRPQPE